MLKNIDALELNNMINKSNTHIFDFRDPEEFFENKIEGAINLNIEDVDEILNIVSNKEDNIIVCCARGIRSVAAGERICELGYVNVYNLDGGMNMFFSKAR